MQILNKTQMRRDPGMYRIDFEADQAASITDLLEFCRKNSILYEHQNPWRVNTVCTPAQATMISLKFG